MTRGKIVLDGKSKENPEKICGIQFFFLVFLSFWTVCAYPKLKQQQKIRFRERLALFEPKKWLRFWAINWFAFGKAGSVFEDLWRFAGNFWENLTPILGKSVTDFEATSHPTLRKSARDFGKISHQFWNKLASFLIKTGSVFGEIRHRLWGNPSPTLGKSATDFGKIRYRL